MSEFILFAKPWWINLAIFIPVASYFIFRKKKLSLLWRQIIFVSLFATAFGFIEAAVVVYLRAAIGLLPGYEGSLNDIIALSSEIYQRAGILKELPRGLMIIEFLRETATILVLISISLLITKTKREKLAIFLWSFAIWDIVYYLGLWLTTGWPHSLLAPDVLFLIPVPWVSQVWFPILISGLTLAAIIINNKGSRWYSKW